MQRIRKNGATSNIETVRLLQDGTGANPGYGKTALTSASTGLIISTICDNEATPTVYTVAGSTIETVTTLGTYAAPTATKCRFKLIDDTNNPGDYELQFADARYAVSSAKMMRVTISGVTGVLPKSFVIQLTATDVDNGTTGGISNVDATVSSRSTYAGADTSGTTTLLARVTSGRATNLDNLDAAVSSRSTYAGADTSGTTTLLTRLTAARAGYLDNINVGGNVASHADITAINQSASKHMTLATVGQYAPGETYTIEMRTYQASDGSAVNADSTPTLTATGNVSGSLAANLSAATNPATGVYRWTYTPGATPTLEQIRMDGSATIASATFTLSAYTQTVDEPTAVFTSTDKSNLTAVFNKLPSGNIADQTTDLAIKAKTDLIATNAADSPNEIAAQSAITNLRRMIAQTSGTVWFVATTGNDSTGDGLSFATAYLTPIKAASVASAGDTILLGPGTFALGNAVCNLPDGVSMFGMGRRRTTITSTALLSDKGAIVKPGTNSVVAHLGIIGVGSSIFQALFGFYDDATTPQTTATNWLLDDVYLEGDTDGIYLRSAPSGFTPPPPTPCRGRVRNCQIRTLFDCVATFAGGVSPVAWDCIVNFEGFNDFRAIGPSIAGVASHTSRAVNCEAGTLRFFGGYYEAGGSSSINSAVAVPAGVGGQVELYDAKLVSSGANALDLQNVGYTIIVNNTQYDTSKTSGAITLRTAPPDENLDATVSSRMATFAYTAPDNTNIGVAASAATSAATNAAAAATAANAAATAATSAQTSAASAAHLLDDAASSHNTANTIGAKINAAGGAADPLANTVPGSYVAGSAGYALGHLSAGSGDTPVNHNSGGTDNLRYVDGNGDGIAGARISAYVASEWTASPLSATIRGQAFTLSDGRWSAAMLLNSGLTYTFVFEAAGYTNSTKTLTV